MSPEPRKLDAFAKTFGMAGEQVREAAERLLPNASLSADERVRVEAEQRLAEAEQRFAAKAAQAASLTEQLEAMMERRQAIVEDLEKLPRAELIEMLASYLILEQDG